MNSKAVTKKLESIAREHERIEKLDEMAAQIETAADSLGSWMDGEEERRWEVSIGYMENISVDGYNLPSIGYAERMLRELLELGFELRYEPTTYSKTLHWSLYNREDGYVYADLSMHQIGENLACHFEAIGTKTVKQTVYELRCGDEVAAGVA